jgi:hypothetical protein
MSTKAFCDFCGREVAQTQKYVVSVASRLERDACTSCGEIVARLLMKPIDRLQRALEAASDR